MRLRSDQRLPTSWLILLAAAGVLCGHALAYWIAPVHAHADGSAHVHDHGYLRLVAVLLVPAATVLLGRIVLLEVASGRRLLSFRRLVAVQLGVFIVQEGSERLAAGGDLRGLLAEPVLWLGLAAQLVVAVLAVGAGRAAMRAVQCSCRPLRILGFVSLLRRSLKLAWTSPARTALPAPISRRGPPSLPA